MSFVLELPDESRALECICRSTFPRKQPIVTGSDSPKCESSISVCNRAGEECTILYTFRLRNNCNHRAWNDLRRTVLDYALNDAGTVRNNNLDRLGHLAV